MRLQPIRKETCPDCGKPFDASQGCAVCLMKLGMSANGDAAPEGGFALPTAEELNQLIPQLHVSRLVGRGGMGAIYQARQMTLERDVAVKLIAKELSRDTSFLERFEREAKALAKLSHPNIVTVYDFGHTEPGQAFLIMEYVDGINLRDTIQGARIGVSDALELVTATCRGLQYAHTKGVVHRDIKPENILLSDDGQVKIADFGIAKIVDESIKTPTLTATRQVLGSLHYLAPEHIEAPTLVDHRVDLYALGVVFYELLTGQLPLGRYEPPSQLNPEVDSRIDTIVLKALSRKPSERFQSAEELADAVVRVRAGSPVSNASYDSSAGMPGRAVSVPFSCDAMAGFAEAVGVLYAEDNVLRAEFRIRDTIWGSVKSKTHVVKVPAENLTRLELVSSLFGHKMVLSTDKITALGELPNAETGVVEVKIKQSNTDYAKKLVASLGFTPATPDRSRGKDGNEQNRTVFGILLMVCGVMNMGFLAMLETVASYETSGGFETVLACILSAVVFVPIFVLQLLAGFLNLFSKPRGLSIATLVVSILPITPTWLISFPLAIWARRWLLNKKPAANGILAGPQATKSWGATTMMFVRETRWSRVIAALNILALLSAGIAFGVYKLGWYTTDLEFRIIAAGNVDELDVDNSVRDRLSSKTDWAYVSRNRNLLRVTTWACNTEQTLDLLQLQGDMQLVWIPVDSNGSPDSNGAEDSNRSENKTGSEDKKALPGEDKSSVDAAKTVGKSEAVQSFRLPAVQGLAIPGVQRDPKSLGETVAIQTQAIELDSAMVSRLTTQNTTPQRDTPAEGVTPSRLLVIKLTSLGRQQLADAAPESRSGLGLVIDGLLQGYASNENINYEEARFVLSPNSTLTDTAIIAAIRGPKFDAELEPLTER